MLYTLTLNPAIDCYIWADTFVTGVINRCRAEELRVGGKGINVSIVLRALGLDSVVLGFVAGNTGTMIEEELAKLNLRSDLNRLKTGLSRINVKIQADAETAINASGPALSEEDFTGLLRKMDAVLRPGDLMVLSGSVPDSLSDTAYASIVERYKDRIRLVVDAAGELLKNTLEHRPFLIKPNLEEMGGLFGRSIHSEEDILRCGRELCARGAQNVLVSRGRDGAILIGGDGAVLVGRTPERTVYSTVGAGDAMIGGFIAGYEAHGSLEEAFVMGLAAGSASVFSRNGFARDGMEPLIPVIRAGCERREPAKSL